MCLKTNTKVQITEDEDFIKQPFLKLYAKLKGNTHEIKKPHADESGTRDFENICFVACPCALNKKNNKVTIMLDGSHEATISETICQTQGEY